MSNSNKTRWGFTLIELLVAVSVSSILVGITAATYGVFRKSITRDQAKADLDQNARVAFDRMVREIRQTPAIVTDFPDNPSDPSPPQPGEIEFEDGHTMDLTYHRYYLNGTTLELDTKEYYFISDPLHNRVKWNQVDSFGKPPIAHVISTQDIATSVQSMVFYGSKPLQMYLTTNDGNGQSFQLRTYVYERNT